MRTRSALALPALVAGAAAALGCAGPWMAPTVRASAIVFDALDTVPLTTLPYGQSYAWVEPSRVLRGTLPRDDRVGHWRTVVRLRESVDVPLRALAWYSAPDSTARYHVAILYAERTAMVPIGQRAIRGDLEGSRSWGTEIPQVRVYRGVAIRRVSDGATFVYFVLGADRWTGETMVANAVAEFALGRQPPPSSP